MKKKQIVGLIAAIVLFILSGFASMSAARVPSLDVAEQFQERLKSITDYPDEPFLGVIDVTGTIQDVGSSTMFTVVDYDHNGILGFIDDMMENEDNTGLFLNVDSPGGYTYQIRELYDRLEKYKEETGRPVYAYCNSYCCSGGYYLAATADEIYANPESIVGSIGCIMSSYDVSGLYDKLGIREVNIASGKNKAMGSPGTEMTEEQMSIYQSIVDESYERFVDAVEAGRPNLTRDEIYGLADGRIFTSNQAMENGLIDGIVSYEEYCQRLEELTGTSVSYRFGQDLESFYTMFFEKARELVPSSDVNSNRELLEKYEKGGLMYYADVK